MVSMTGSDLQTELTELTPLLIVLLFSEAGLCKLESVTNRGIDGKTFTSR